MTDQTTTPLTTQQLDEIEAIATRAADDPFYVSDCEGSLQVWREKALTGVRRDANGEIEMYSFPSSYRVTDQIIEIDLNTWDPGEDETDDKQRQDIYDLVEARAAVGVLLAEVRRLRARTLTESEYDAAWHAVEGAAGEEGADPGTVLHAVLDRLRIGWATDEETHVVADDSDDPEHVDDCPGCTTSTAGASRA